MSYLVSTLGIQVANTNILKNEQASMAKLNEQLASGKQSSDLTDYSPSEALNLLNLDATITKREGFINVIETISTRINVYDQSLTGIEDLAAQAASLTNTSPIYNESSNTSNAEQIKGFMQQMAYYLNQQVGDRYIFAGSRYGTSPVTDITALGDPTLETYPASDPDLPAYDSDFTTSPTSPEAYDQDVVSIDTTQSLEYGITSTQEPFQYLVMGLRYAYQATQDQANYETYMTTARDLITQGLDGIRGIHSTMAATQTVLDQVKSRHAQAIDDINNQISDIQSVDVSEVAVKVNTLQTQMEASYSVTAKMAELTILNYL